MKFTEENIVKIFGHEAAENEDITRLKSYYLKGSTYDQVVNDLPIRILVGHKGIGKSALFRVAMEDERQSKKLSILIKPDDIDGIADEEKEINSLIKDWKNGIIEIVSRKALESFGLEYEGFREKLNKAGGKFINFLRTTLQAKDHADLSEADRIIIDQFKQTGNMYIYLDDLDRGWEGRSKDIKRISALLNAIRDLSSDTPQMHFRVSLRSDVYYLVRTSDESTDKIEGSVVWQSWTNHEILALLAKRIDNYHGKETDTSELLNKTQPQLAEHLNGIMTHRFEGKGHWKNIPTYRMLMSLIRRRPRDLVKLCTSAAREAISNNKEIIDTDSFNSVFEDYSQSRLQDTINEYRSELPDIERLLLGMKPSKRQRNGESPYIYDTEKLLKKIANIQQSGPFKFAGSKTASDRWSLAAFMYKINFITARKEIGEYIDRKYFEENRYLQNKFVDFGFEWEIHPAYRWALQPESINDIFTSMKPSTD